MNIYLDTCVWLNIFNKNESSTINGKISKKLVENILFKTNNKIIYSGFILRELENKLNKNFNEKREYFRKEDNIIFIKATPLDYSFARQIENKYKSNLSFFDCLHLAICKNNNFILITLDRELLNIAKLETKAYSPKKLLQRINFI